MQISLSKTDFQTQSAFSILPLLSQNLNIFCELKPWCLLPLAVQDGVFGDALLHVQ